MITIGKGKFKVKIVRKNGAHELHRFQNKEAKERFVNYVKPRLGKDIKEINIF